MRLVKISFLALVWAIPSARGEEIAVFGKTMAGFADHANSGRSLLISEDGEAHWLDGDKIAASKKYKIAHESCIPRTQSTMVMGDGASGQGFTLAYPFLVGAERACLINDSVNTISLIEDYRSRLPRDYFSAVFLGEDKGASYFMVNGRPFPDGDSGYLLLLTIDKSTFALGMREIMGQVPGLSGAMSNNGESIWVTAWMQTNDIYRASKAAILGLAQSGTAAAFPELFEKAYGGIDGLSFFMIGNGRSFFYHNEGYESYLVNKATGAKEAAPPCPPVRGNESGWILLCNGRSLQNWRQ